MSWPKAILEAQQWATSNSLGFFMVSKDEKARRITFRGPSTSFYVTVPESANFEQCEVWSEDDRCAESFPSHLVFTLTPEKSMMMVLQDVATRLGSNGSQKAEQGDKGNSDDDKEEEEEEEVEEETYYDEEDMYLEESAVKESSEETLSASDFFTGQGSPAAVHRLLADLKTFNKSSSKCGISGKPKGDNLFVWNVELSDFEPTSLLGKDLAAYALKYGRKPVIEMEMKFPKEYPMFPPFVRVLRPRFKFLTGHVTIGGSICMEMLTRSGWTPSNDIESILVQVRAEIMSDPKAQLDPRYADQEYNESEAQTSFERMVQKYGWH